MRELEEAVELKLFDRTTRQVQLTHAGASLERRIGRLLDEIDLTLREERAAYEGHRGVVALASNPVLSSSWIAQGLARCASAFPELVVTVEDQAQSGVLASVEHGEVDFGVVSLAEPLANDQLHAQPVFTTPLHAVMPPTHPLARHASVAWGALQNWALVTLNADAGVRAALDRAFIAHGLKRRPVQEFGHVAAVQRTVELGLGVGVLPVDAHWPAVGESLVSRPLAPAVTLTTLLVHRRNRSLRPNAAAAWAQFAGHAGAHSQNADRDTEANPDGAADVVASAASPDSSWPMAAQSGAALHEP
ncbi:MAG: Transcriptional regulator, LysR family [uncultured Paraburkholderia sp.]|nr:MAG: Transcriptional regulator, LysR family [uncultured Paraburkholderia sp.]CAH2800942.1 MAG: Transcriptional regulator, LysR family [uncultured Paraburkholderia sp.]CAH2935492.1 MAG: Transcriptional regulator, LysR family [uncultured Paraburkholderia sp.]CAH2938586.1 MAG: Transcriptional regulator, LysR family [uncultured Paraburkholderia sp.]